MTDRAPHTSGSPLQPVDKAGGFRVERASDPDVSPMPVAPARDHSWSVVATVRGETTALADFAAWHLQLGADRITLYLDDPDETQMRALQRPEVQVVACDAGFWAARHGRPDAHQNRQIRNASEAWRAARTDWLLHIDVDEFLLPPQPVRDCLAQVPADIALVHLPPVEMLSGGDGLFKRTARAAGHKSHVLTEVYPTFGQYLRGGFLSHLEGKNFLRVGRSGSGRRVEKVRFGIHRAFVDGQPITNRVTLPDLPLGHAHAPSWEAFQSHLSFRRLKGSYRSLDRNGLNLAELIDYLEASEGRAGLRALYAEVCEASPPLLNRLRERDMLMTYPMDLPRIRQAWYPELAS